MPHHNNVRLHSLRGVALLSLKANYKPKRSICTWIPWWLSDKPLVYNRCSDQQGSNTCHTILLQREFRYTKKMVQWVDFLSIMNMIRQMTSTTSAGCYRDERDERLVLPSLRSFFRKPSKLRKHLRGLTCCSSIANMRKPSLEQCIFCYDGTY